MPSPRASSPPYAASGRGRAPGRYGLGFAVVAAASFGTSGTFGSSLIGAGWSPAAAVLARMSLAAVVLTVPALLQLRGRWTLLRRSAGLIVGYGLLAVAGGQLFYFNAVARIPVGVALLLEYLGAVLVVGWLWLRHRQRPRSLTIAGTITALAGLAMVLNVAGSARIDPLGVMWGLLAAVGLAAFYVLSARHGEELPPVVMSWAGLCLGSVAIGALGLAGALPLTAPAADVHLAGHRVSWIVPVLGLSLLAAVVAYLAGIGAARRLGAKLSSFIGMSEVLFAIAFAWLALRQLPTGLQFAGGALILAGVTLVRTDELRGEAAELDVQAERAVPAGREVRDRAVLAEVPDSASQPAPALTSS